MITAAKLRKKLFKTILKPPPLLTVSDWADKYRYLSSEASAEAGKWSTARAEYQRGIMDALNDDLVERIVIMSSAQIGKTEIENNIIGYFIDQDPCPILVVYPTETMARTFSEDRLSPMLRDTPCLKDKVKDPRSRDGKNTKLHKVFPGGHIAMVGSNSPASLASRPIRVVLFDEVDRFPSSSGGQLGEGDVITLGMKRTQTFFNRKIVLVSTPTIKDISRISLAYEQSDQRRFYVPCHACGEFQHLEWKQVSWGKDKDGNHLPDTAVYACKECGAVWTDKERLVSVKKGEWRAGEKFNGTAGFHLNELYSSWTSFERIVQNFVDSKKSPELLKAFVNTSLGECWEEEGEFVDSMSLDDRREDYDLIPFGVGVVCASVDVQDDRLELLILGFGVDNEIWALNHVLIYGDPSKKESWQALDDYLFAEYEHESGQKLKVACTCIDSGGHHTTTVYEYVRQREQRRVYAIKGISAHTGKMFVTRPIKSKVHTIKLFSIASDIGKDTLFARLKISYNEFAESQPGYIHFNKKFDSEFFSQFSAEKRVIRYHKGFPRREYRKVRDRNEAIDLFVYGLAAYEILQIKNIRPHVERVSRPVKIDNKTEKPIPVQDQPQIKRSIRRPSRKSGFVNRY